MAKDFTIQHLYSDTPNSKPTSLEAGEIAINRADKKIYISDSNNTIVAIGGEGGNTSTPNPDNVVTIDTEQTITGEKTFNKKVRVNNSTYDPTLTLFSDKNYPSIKAYYNTNGLEIQLAGGSDAYLTIKGDDGVNQRVLTNKKRGEFDVDTNDPTITLSNVKASPKIRAYYGGSSTYLDLTLNAMDSGQHLSLSAYYSDGRPIYESKRILTTDDLGAVGGGGSSSNSNSPIVIDLNMCIMDLYGDTSAVSMDNFGEELQELIWDLWKKLETNNIDTDIILKYNFLHSDQTMSSTVSTTSESKVTSIILDSYNPHDYYKRNTYSLVAFLENYSGGIVQVQFYIRGQYDTYYPVTTKENIEIWSKVTEINNNLVNGGSTDTPTIQVVQTSGSSQSAVMSQAATTNYLQDIYSKINPPFTPPTYNDAKILTFDVSFTDDAYNNTTLQYPAASLWVVGEIDAVNNGTLPLYIQDKNSNIWQVLNPVIKTVATRTYISQGIIVVGGAKGFEVQDKFVFLRGSILGQTYISMQNICETPKSFNLLYTGGKISNFATVGETLYSTYGDNSNCIGDFTGAAQALVNQFVRVDNTLPNLTPTVRLTFCDGISASSQSSQSFLLTDYEYSGGGIVNGTANSGSIRCRIIDKNDVNYPSSSRPSTYGYTYILTMRYTGDNVTWSIARDLNP